MRPRQARPLLWLALLLLPACEVPGQLNARLLGRDISGAAQEARLPPPGLDRPFPNLASVPPIPERPNPATRLAITQGLQHSHACARARVCVRVCVRARCVDVCVLCLCV